MMVNPSPAVSLSAFDDATARLVRCAAAIAASEETVVRATLSDAVGLVPRVWMEEAVLQSYLFAGFPRTLNAMREWRRVAGPVDVASSPEVVSGDVDAWRAQGEGTCAAVYGSMYARLRENIRALHPSLDEWMIVEGYGKVLSRPGLDLGRRELCIVAACTASGQDRQLHSHLHGALNVGVPGEVVRLALEALRGGGLVDDARVSAARALFARITGDGR
jgi:4-carboxymuconolactone decarboxylase